MAHSRGHICQCLPRIFTLRRNSPLMISSGRRKTGGEFIGAVLDLACGLLGSGVRPGDVVAIAAFNSDLYVEWLLAITYVGGIVAPLNYRWSFEEARAAIELVSPVMLVVDEFCSFWALQLQKHNYIPSLRLYVLIGDSNSQSLSGVASVLIMNRTKRSLQGALTANLFWAPKDIALICFTSGTTGQPKGVAISHTALIVQSLAKIAIVGYAEDDVYLHIAPLCHIGGISSCIAMLMAAGGHVFMPKFDAKSSIQAIEEHHVTSLITVPAMMADLISYARESNKWEGGKTMKKILNGGGVLSFELISSATRIFPYAKIVSAYGMTEASSSLTFMILYDPSCSKFQTSVDDIHGASSAQLSRPHGGIRVGKPAPHVEIQINSDHAISCSHSVGRILTRGLHVMAGYWQKTTRIQLNSDGHGWLDTGDIGWFDDNGDLWLIGRGKDRIKTGGENVYPEEVEAVLAQHPGVSNVVVTSIPDIRMSEKVVACVTVREGWHWVDGMSSDQSTDKKELSGEILQNFCRQRNLTRFKIPKDYMLWKKPFPLTTTGKLRRDEFRKEVILSMHFLPSML